MRLTGLRATVVVAVVGFIVGLLVGWLLIGWLLWPVKWVDADPVDLRDSHRRDYVAMVADSYSVNRDITLARQRLSTLPLEEQSVLLGNLHADYTRQGRGAEAQRIKDLANNLNIQPAQKTPAVATSAVAPVTPAITPAPAAGAGFPWGTIIAVCGILLAVVFVIAGAALGWSYLQRKRAGGPPKPPVTTPAPEAVSESPAAPITFGTFVTTYHLGDKHYDDCFSIETSARDFLGECGVGVSEMLGEGDLSAATAFEVWLFDKSDIRTVTKVLMSEYAYYDENLRAKLAPKGELVLAEPGTVVTLETAALRVRAEIQELAYAAGEGAERAQFARMTLELRATSREGGAPTA